MRHIKWVNDYDGSFREADTDSGNDNDLLKEIAKVVAEYVPPTRISVYVDQNLLVQYSLTLRSETILISETWITDGLCFKDYDPVYLTMVNSEHNNYKFYKLSSEFGKVTASYGRIGANRGELFGERSCTYEMSMFWPKYFEKVAKGYIDQSDIYLTEEYTAEEEKPLKKETPKNTISAKLYAQLKAFAKHLVETSCISITVTKGMVAEGKRLLMQLYEAEGVDEFNEILLKLVSISPRKVDKVERLLATSVSSFASIVQREENLLAAMGVLLTNRPEDISSDTLESFSDGIEIHMATEKQKEEVLNHLSNRLRPMVKNVYRVIDRDGKEKFESYLKSHNIVHRKQLWHGSRNENWLSIINTRLSLHPNAKITGKMFGNGIYFAPSSMKSWGYTSMEGARWSGSGAKTGFMGLFATAYGEPLDVYTTQSFSESTLGGKNCVHAHAGQALLNDEVIFYNEDAMLLNYLVEFAA